MNSRFRRDLVELLKGGHAHVTIEGALDGLDPKLRDTPALEGMHSIWDNIEHMRLAQEDILRYTLDPTWSSPSFPEGYWPKPADRLSDAMWTASLEAFRADQEALIKLIEDENLDLTAEIPHGEGRTYLREILLVADHNAYHLGQIVAIRKSLGSWNG